jgi:hypothetical protein
MLVCLRLVDAAASLEQNVRTVDPCRTRPERGALHSRLGLDVWAMADRNSLVGKGMMTLAAEAGLELRSEHRHRQLEYAR